jgi:excisionase family DNA binding protein
VAQDDSEDPWLTLAEIADELRLTPATIRSWVSTGILRAWRPGKRKYLVRRSELDRFLAGEDDEPSASEIDRPSRSMDTVEAPHRSPTWPTEAVEHISKGGWLGFAETAWRQGLRSSALAPPDVYFILRLRRVAEAAVRKANAMANLGDERPPAWWGKRPVVGGGGLSYELRPGGNRPGPPELWDAFDSTVNQLSSAETNGSWTAEIEALSALSLVIQDIVEELEHHRTYPWSEDARRGDPELTEIPDPDDEPDDPGAGPPPKGAA